MMETRPQPLNAESSMKLREVGSRRDLRDGLELNAPDPTAVTVVGMETYERLVIPLKADSPMLT